MDASSAAPKSTSRWGSFLQQAVAGVESRLDNILADEDATSTSSKDTYNQQAGKPESSSTSPKTRSSAGISRNLSRSRKNERLQERLAKAVVNKSNTKLVQSSIAPASGQHHIDSPSSSGTSPRTSLDSRAEESAYDTHQSTSQKYVLQDYEFNTNGLQNETNTSREVQPQRDWIEYSILENHATPYFSAEPHLSESPQFSVDQSMSASANCSASEALNKEASTISLLHHEKSLAQMRSEYEAAELRRQEEMHEYLERIDALQAKLQYLTKEVIENVRKTTSESQRDSAEAKLAAKDEKIALLIDEGQKLSQLELKHLNSIRNLRAKSIEDAKQLSSARKTADDYQKNIYIVEKRAKRAETMERNELERSKVLRELEKELEKSKAENQLFTALMTDLRQQLAQAQASNMVDETINYQKMLESEQRLALDLRDELSNTKVEKELAAERHRSYIRELQDKTDRERERTRVADEELRDELRVLESRLESFRARAEDISSGDNGDSQVKLLRQVETLQTQYTVATENWRGIESSLLSKITSFEKERDDTSRKDFDVRRKAREANTKLRRLEEDLHRSTSTIQDMEQQSTEREKQLAKFKESLSKAEEDAKALRMELRTEKDTWQSRLNERIEQIKKESREDSSNPADTPYQSFSAESLISNRKNGTVDRASPVQQRYHVSPGFIAGAIPFPDRPVSRRPSAQASAVSGIETPHRHDSTHSVVRQSVNGGIGIPDTPSIRTERHDDFFDEVTIPTTSGRTVNDMVSMSTTAAGPSVQLVERMSAAVRRLETEKASYKDELERLSIQRDEAREQVVALMGEAEEKRSGDKKIQSLQAEVTEINQRYQTTLEMLGERSELVEELRADVADLKQMYRDLVENTLQ